MSTNIIKFKEALYAADASIQSGSGTLYETKELKADSLEANSFSITVHGTSADILKFKKNDKIEYYRDDRRQGIFYLQSVKRVGPEDYSLYALSTVGRLMTMRHPGGLYSGQTVEEVIKSIFGDIPVLIQSVYSSIKLYGYLPYADGTQISARDNLVQVLFAIGAYLDTDENGICRIQKLWDGTLNVIGADRISFDECDVQQLSPISAVEVSEHQWIENTDEVTLFEGVAQAGDTIVFSEPMHDLAAMGFVITESGHNYAILSAGTGTLTGKQYTHSIRVIRKTVTEDVEENIISVTDATLVSLVNSSAVTNRLAEYYRHRELITAKITPAFEKPGYVVGIYHPWDKRIISACIQERETSLSNLLMTQTQLLSGFLPQQPESQEYFNERIVLTGSGEWRVPENVTTITVVLIGGAQGGHCGHGGNPATQKTVSITGNIFDIPQYVTDKWAFGGKGGEGGDPGFGGKILQATLDVTPAQKFSFSCGVGGLGAVFDTNNWANTPNTPGADGTKTTFGSLDSSTGAISEIGYMDPITGEVFASKGEQGIAGGDGAGMNPDAVDSKEAKIRLAPLQATSVVDEDGNVWKGGTTRIEESQEREGTIVFSAGDEQSFTGTLEEGFCGGGVSYNCGSGAAAGENGTPGDSAGMFSLVSVPRNGMPKTSITVTAIGSTYVPGADAKLVPKKPTAYGKGGRGGYGGGGDGATGVSETYYGGRRSGSLNNTPGSVRSTGSNGAQGGPGGDGCIILYYRKFRQVQAGPLVQGGGGLFFDRLNKLFIV